MLHSGNSFLENMPSQTLGNVKIVGFYNIFLVGYDVIKKVILLGDFPHSHILIKV